MLAWGLSRDPREIPSALIGKPVPAFALPPVEGRTLGLSSADLKGEVSLVNVFASWCTACRYEHPLLMRLQAEGAVPIHGLNYKDKPDAATKWLAQLGNPYVETLVDPDGRIGIDYGVYGVPETFVIDQKGIVRHAVVNDLPLGRSVEEAIRMVDALQHFEKHGEVCPANWKAGAQAMKADAKGVASYLAAHA